MEKGTIKRSIKLYTLIILVLLYIVVISFPFSLLVNDTVATILDMVLKAMFLVVAFISINYQPFVFRSAAAVDKKKKK